MSTFYYLIKNIKQIVFFILNILKRPYVLYAVYY